MKHVNDCDLVAIEGVPEGLSSVTIVNQELIRAQNNDFGSFRQKEFSFVGVGGERVRVHSEAIESVVIVDADDEEHQLLLGVSGVCEFKSDSLVLRSLRGREYFNHRIIRILPKISRCLRTNPGALRKQWGVSTCSQKK